jgi:intracellular septation protein
MYGKALLNLFIEFGPIIVFLLCAEIFDFIFATKVFVALTAFAIALAYYVRGRLALFPIFASLTVILTGALTIIFTSPTFIIIETTIYNAICLFAAVISLWLKKPLLELLFKDSFDITATGWRILTKRWAYMFLFLATTNEIVRIGFSTDAWVDYKTAVTLLTAAFGFYQIRLTKKYRNPNATALGLKA